MHPAWIEAADSPSHEQNHIAVVINQQSVPYDDIMTGFRARLSDHKPALKFETFRLSLNAQEQTATIAEVKEFRPRLIVALGSVALHAVSREIQDIPIVFGLVLRDSTRALPDNVTGVFLDFPLESQFSWLRRILPEARRIGVIYNPAQNQDLIVAAKQAATRFGLRLEEHAVTSPRELPAALDALANNADVFWGITDQLVVTPQTAKSLLLFSFRNRIPFIGLSEAWVKAGALYALDRDYPDIGRQCAELAEKILSGARANDLPPETPRQEAYVINRHTAEQMKLELPAKLLQGAAKVY